MKAFEKFILTLMWAFVFAMAIISCLSSCDRRPRSDVFLEAPSPPGDTVKVIRFIDMCNYKYISTDSVQAKKQLERCVKAIDKLIIHYDSIISERRQKVRAQTVILKTLPE